MAHWLKQWHITSLFCFFFFKPNIDKLGDLGKSMSNATKLLLSLKGEFNTTSSLSTWLPPHWYFSFVALNFLSYFTSQPWVFRFKNSLWDLAGCFNRTLIAFLPEITAIKCFIFLSITLSQPIVFANNQNKDTWDTCKGDLNTTKWQELTPAKTEKAWKAVANELIGLVKTSERKASLFKLEFIL